MTVALQPVDPSLPVVLLAALFVTLAAVAQAMTGFGFSIAVLPFLTTLFGVRDGILLTLVLSWFATGLVAVRTRRDSDRPMLKAMTWGGLAGLPIGIAVFHWTETKVLALVVAGAVFAAGASMLAGLRLRFRGGSGQVASAGVLSGVLAGSVGLGGPPLAVFLSGAGLPMGVYRATVANYFGRLNMVLVPLQVVLAQGRAPLLLAVALVPAVLVGSLLGERVLRRLPQSGFDRLVVALVFCSGATSIVTIIRTW